MKTKLVGALLACCVAAGYYGWQRPAHTIPGDLRDAVADNSALGQLGGDISEVAVPEARPKPAYVVNENAPVVPIQYFLDDGKAVCEALIPRREPGNVPHVLVMQKLRFERAFKATKAKFDLYSKRFFHLGELYIEGKAKMDGWVTMTQFIVVTHDHDAKAGRYVLLEAERRSDAFVAAARELADFEAVSAPSAETLTKNDMSLWYQGLDACYTQADAEGKKQVLAGIKKFAWTPGDSYWSGRPPK